VTKRIGMIKKAWDDQKEIRDVMVFLQGHGVSPAYAAKIYKKYAKGVRRGSSTKPRTSLQQIYSVLVSLR